MVFSFKCCIVLLSIACLFGEGSISEILEWKLKRLDKKPSSKETMLACFQDTKEVSLSLSCSCDLNGETEKHFLKNSKKASVGGVFIDKWIFKELISKFKFRNV